MRRTLLRLKRENPELFRRLASELIAPPKARPGRTDWSTWVFVQAVMNVYRVGSPRAAEMLLADSRFRDRAMDKFGNVFSPRSAAALARDYRTAEERRKRDPNFDACCRTFLPEIEQAVRTPPLGQG
jgi:hypothetical protein